MTSACAVSSVNSPFFKPIAAGFSGGLSSNVSIRPKISRIRARLSSSDGIPIASPNAIPYSVPKI